MNEQRNRRRDDTVNRWRAVILAVAVLGAAVLMIAEPVGQGDVAGGAQGALALSAIKQSLAENQQKLQQYKWVETIQVALKGENKSATQSTCEYGPDGKVQKTPLMAPEPSQPPPNGVKRLKQKVVAKKKQEIKDYAGQVKNLLGMYMPPDLQRMQRALQDKKVSMSGGNLVFMDYALPGDQMTLSFDPAAKKISALNVKTYLDDPKDAVTLAVQFASLPDGTNYVQQTILDATAKQMKVTTTNSNYTAVGQ